MVKNKTVLITGATGFIGANLVRACTEAGAETHIFTRPVSRKWRIENILRNSYEHNVDLLDCEGIKTAVHKIRPDVIFHTTTYGGYPFQKQPNSIIQTNIKGIMNLLTVCSHVYNSER